MKCIILCLCCNNEHFKDELLQAKNTWALGAITGYFPDIEIWGYTYGEEYGIDAHNGMIYVPSITDSLTGTWDKMKKVVQALDFFGFEYDCILRTNCSTIINMKLLNEFIHSDAYNPNKIYSGELFMGGFKGGPLWSSIITRGNFMLMSKKYVKLLSDAGESIAKQVNDYSRPISKDMWVADDISMCNIFNSWAMINHIKLTDLWEQLPTQYLPKLYDQTESVYTNSFAFFIKKFGDIRPIEERHEENMNMLKDFCNNYYRNLDADIDKAKDDIISRRYVVEITQNSPDEITTKYINFDQLDAFWKENKLYI